MEKREKVLAVSEVTLARQRGILSPLPAVPCVALDAGKSF
jgi:hypothetical protein